ncbi:hypothetical protein ACEWY4_007692 [Coilia grayii]|uniref:HAT C-terminal dimerisation domain-containing protein n=1 Tax=Coilia grayii TaxID=363190 RepID=A0ABD1K8Y4_9TELE
MDPYITVTAHYITDACKLQARVLCTSMMPERHTAVNIADRLSEVIKEWDIKVFCMVHDNASNMNLAMEICEKFPKDLGWTRHTLQLAIKSGLVLPDVVKAIDAAPKPTVQKSLAMTASQWKLVEQLIPVLQSLANMINTTLRVQASDLATVRTFKMTVQEQLEKRFKLELDDLMESIPIAACMLDDRFKHLQFVQLFGPHYQSWRTAANYSTAGEEVRNYLQTQQIPTMQNPLQWWAPNKDRFPSLAKLCKRYLAVPATSTPSERIFSLAGNTITRQWASLHPAHVDALVFLHANQGRKTKPVTETVIEQDCGDD